MRKGYNGLGLALVAVWVSAWTAADDPVPTGPYTLHYPTLFGGRFTIPAYYGHEKIAYTLTSSSCNAISPNPPIAGGGGG
ncbi:hypothetical protein [Spirosoma litoris]